MMFDSFQAVKRVQLRRSWRTRDMAGLVLDRAHAALREAVERTEGGTGEAASPCSEFELYTHVIIRASMIKR